MTENLRGRAEARLVEPEASSEQEQVEEGNSVSLVSSPQEKALSNEYILKEMMNYLPNEDLVECRLVNKLWNDVATRVFAPKAPILKLCDTITNKKLLNKFMETMSNSGSNPCRKFCLSTSILRGAAPEEHLLLAQFFEHVAPFVIHLEINAIYFPMSPTVKPKEGLEYPKLVELRFGSVNLEAHLDAFINILKHVPKLERISLGFVNDAVKDGLFRVVKQVPWTQIQHFTLFQEMKDEDFKRMMDIIGNKPQLQSFWCSNILCTKDNLPRQGNNIRLFLEAQQDTLTTLRLSFNQVCPEIGFDLPPLPKLRSLQIDSFLISPSSSQLSGILSERFPVLSSVSLGGQYWRHLETLEQSPLETVKTLNLGENEKLLLARVGHNTTSEQIEMRVRGTIRSAGQTFPRVQNLTLPASSTVLKAVGLEKVWGDVEQLTLLCGFIGMADSALTGYSEEECRRMVPGIMAVGETENNILRFLKQIKILRFKHSAGGWKGCLTNLGCSLVLLELKNLKCVDLREHHPEKMSLSKTMIQEMQDKFQVLLIKSKK